MRAAMADTRIVVTTGALSHFQEDGQRWVKQFSPLLWHPVSVVSGTQSFVHPHGKGGYQVKDICNELGVPFLGELTLSEGCSHSSIAGRWRSGCEDDRGKTADEEPARNLLLTTID